MRRRVCAACSFCALRAGTCCQEPSITVTMTLLALLVVMIAWEAVVHGGSKTDTHQGADENRQMDVKVRVVID